MIQGIQDAYHYCMMKLWLLLGRPTNNTLTRSLRHAMQLSESFIDKHLETPVKNSKKESK